MVTVGSYPAVVPALRCHHTLCMLLDTAEAPASLTNYHSGIESFPHLRARSNGIASHLPPPLIQVATLQ